ncbi:MEKHLA domain-containing protein [Cohnella sp.]|uniref:MEKHLA domain-containing protein n=1 Tax=Cohnella sp. TaxID=1883426 RepID=UPI0035650BB1
MNLEENMRQLEAHSKMLIESYKRVTGNSLLEVQVNTSMCAEALFNAQFVLLSHGTELDPVLNYGNRLALELWEMDWSTFTSTPSRLTAEPMERGQREKLLENARTQGFSADYTGVRISRSGRRFEIRNAIIWSVLDSYGRYQGQAAVFSEWNPL